MAYGWKFTDFRVRIAGQPFLQMRKTCTLCIGVTFPFLLGNAQDDAALTGANTTTPAETAVAMGYAAQGNVAMNQAQKENEVQAALQKAREKRALQQAMVNYTQKPEPITTAEQFLAANRPPMPRSSGPSEFAVTSRQQSYVPEFEPQTGPADSGMTASVEPALPSRKPGLFDRLRSKKPKQQEVGPAFDDAPVPPPADDTTGMSDTESAAPAALQPNAAAAISFSDGQESEKPGLLGRLFKREKGGVATLPQDPAVVMEPVVTAPPVEAVPEADVPGGIPSPPGFDDPAAPSVRVTPSGSD
jgi:hypothetical protein